MTKELLGCSTIFLFYRSTHQVKKLRRVNRLSFYPVILVPASPAIASSACSNEQIIALPPCSANLMATSIFVAILPPDKWPFCSYCLASSHLIATYTFHSASLV